jgi:hypothetical protein
MTKWVSLKCFVEEDDILVDLLTKFQPNLVCNLRKTIKTPVRAECATNSLFCIVDWIFALLGGCHLSRRVRMTSHGSVRCQGTPPPKF